MHPDVAVRDGPAAAESRDSLYRGNSRHRDTPALMVGTQYGSSTGPMPFASMFDTSKRTVRTKVDLPHEVVKGAIWARPGHVVGWVSSIKLAHGAAAALQ